MVRITIISKGFSTSRAARHRSAHLAAPRRRRSRLFRSLRFEALEDRRVLTTFTVTNLNDATVTGPGSAPGTLRQAVYDANVSSDADIIDFAPGLAGDLRLSISDDSAIQLSALLVTSPITIQGNAAGITIRRDITAPEMRFFRVVPDGELALDSISLTGGIARGANGASGQNGSTAFGGAIFNQGSVQIIASTLYNNTAIGGNAGAGAYAGTGQGGAVFNDGGTVTIRNATLSGNSVSNGFGAVFNGSFGGGVYSKNGFSTIDNSTITNGTASSGRQLYLIGIGAGQTAIAQIHSSIIAQSDVQVLAYDVNATEDLGGQVIVTGSNNLIRHQNLFQSIAVSSDDPMLGTLTTNGGPTRTHALLEGSPAIGQGSNVLNLVNDQRGDSYARVVGTTIDIGAFELQTVATPELPGDYNSNHSVDAADFVVWRKTKGADVPQYSGADGNGNSTVDDADYDVWRAHFGAPASASATVAASQLISVAAEQQLDARSLHSHDSALFGALAEFARYSKRFELNIDYLSIGEQVSRNINRHDHDEALLAVTALHFGPPKSTSTKISSYDERETDAASPDTDDITPPLDVAFTGCETTP